MTLEQIEQAIQGFAGYSATHHGIGGELLTAASEFAALLRECESASARVPEEWVRRLSTPVTAEELKRAWNMIGQAHPQKEWVERALIGFIELRLAAAPKSETEE